MKEHVASSGSDAEQASDEATASGSDHSDMEEEVGTVPFEQLEALRRDGAVSGRALVRKSSKAQQQQQQQQQQQSFRRENKNRPREASSKRPVPRLRDVVEVTKRESRDPRFDTLSGKLVPERFRKQYAFLYDEQMPAERDELRATLQKTRAEEKRKELQAQLTRVQQQIREEESTRRKEAWEAAQKKKEREAVKAGKGVFFPKRAERKRAQLVARYQELKDSGRLEKVMAKRRRKNAVKDHRYVPRARREQ